MPITLLAGPLPAVALVAGVALGSAAQPGTVLSMLLAAVIQAVVVQNLRWRASALRDEADRLMAAGDSDRMALVEVQHRVANAMQFTSSLLTLQADRVRDANDAAEALRDAGRRLGAVAGIHRRLHDPRLAGAGMGETLRDIVVDLLEARGLVIGADGVRLDVAVDAPVLGLPRATAVAMIVTEAVTNAAKYAFVNGRGALTVALRATGDEVMLEVVDDGPGPPTGADRAETLGMLVMQAMAHRLGGRFGFGAAPAGGARVAIVFPQAAP